MVGLVYLGYGFIQTFVCPMTAVHDVTVALTSQQQICPPRRRVLAQHLVTCVLLPYFNIGEHSDSHANHCTIYKASLSCGIQCIAASVALARSQFEEDKKYYDQVIVAPIYIPCTFYFACRFLVFVCFSAMDSS